MKCSKRNLLLATAAIGLLSVAALASFSKPPVTNPPVTGEIQAPVEVMQLFERACYNCHSNETQLSWFDKLPVAASLVGRHVAKARAHLNFSEWNKLSAADQKSNLWEIYNMMNAGVMPLPSYTALHPGAKVNGNDLAALRKYLHTLEVKPPHDTVAMQATTQAQPAAAGRLPVSANGIAFIPEYRNWQVMSTTSRQDNATMRVMYANPIAIKAIKSGAVHPWPDGAIIAKVVWEKREDAAGNIRPFQFVNIQYMVRNEQQYRATNGWGYARFDSPQLKPYGTLATFTKCSSCHEAARQNGYVFDLSVEH